MPLLLGSHRHLGFCTSWAQAEQSWQFGRCRAEAPRARQGAGTVAVAPRAPAGSSVPSPADAREDPVHSEKGGTALLCQSRFFHSPASEFPSLFASERSAISLQYKFLLRKGRGFVLSTVEKFNK